ncbi:MAG: HU family DNA-binding protein [Dysgonomonas sp.]|jgi:Bacterial nucleoid DNA-binding protein|nr:HU family DNA-binding protein [Dysgonomonas sp.]
MNDSRLCEDIKQNLEAQGINLSEAEVADLYISALDKISEILDQGDIIDISDFGSFWRKKNETSSSTFFKPSDNIQERINQ